MEAEEENVHINSPERKHMTSTNSSPTSNGLTCTYKGYEVPDAKTEKRVEVVIPPLTLSYYNLFLALLSVYIYVYQSIYMFKKNGTQASLTL